MFFPAVKTQTTWNLSLLKGARRGSPRTTRLDLEYLETRFLLATATLVRDIWGGTPSSNPQDMININGTLFFKASDGPAARGSELWKSNGLANGTEVVRDINQGGAGSNPAFLTNVNGTLYFTATDGEHGFELWKSDGTAAGTVMVKDVRGIWEQCNANSPCGQRLSTRVLTRPTQTFKLPSVPLRGELAMCFQPTRWHG